MAAAHSAATCRNSACRSSLLRERRTRYPSTRIVSSRRFQSFCLLALLTRNFMQQTVVKASEVQTCSSSATSLFLRLSSTNQEVKFKCGPGLQLRAKPKNDEMLWGNAACTKEVDASSLTFTPPTSISKSESGYSLKVKSDALLKTPFTVYFLCDPTSSSGGDSGSKQVIGSGSSTTCLIQVSVFSQNPTPVPDANKCKDGQVALAITSTTKSVTFGCNERATLEPRLFEHVFIEEQSQSGRAAATLEEKEVVLQALVPNSSLVENAADTTPTTVGYTLSCPNLPSSAQTFFYKCVPPNPPSVGSGRTGTPQGCKVLISVEKRPDSDATATPAPSGGEQGIVLSSSFMIVSMSFAAMVAGNGFSAICF
ncbi:SAG-related sequence SRS49A [Toxoplasma gondii GT1]|nr:SAG-related sequence SRS49A [Toxoplasma gondii GT1]KAF4639920.1 SAG-related sequence SRS49A [Toxoplasma gondii]